MKYVLTVYILVLVLVSGCSLFNHPKNINWDEFETQVLEDNEIIQLSIYDKEKMYVYVSVHPGPYKNKKRIADYVIDIEDVLWVEKRLNELSLKTGNQRLLPSYSKSGNTVVEFAFNIGLVALLILVTSLIILPVYAGIKIYQSQFLTINEKLFWIILIIIFPLVGLIFYLLFGRRFG